MNRFNWRLMKPIQELHRFLYTIGLGPIIGNIVLLLTTIGRKTGKKRVTPVQYEEIDGSYYIAAARGREADWFHNIQADPSVGVQVKENRFSGQAEAVTDPLQITDFLEQRLKLHPRMIGTMMRMHNLPSRPRRDQLEDLAKSLAMVIIHPVAKIKSNKNEREIQ